MSFQPDVAQLNKNRSSIGFARAYKNVRARNTLPKIRRVPYFLDEFSIGPNGSALLVPENRNRISVMIVWIQPDNTSEFFSVSFGAPMRINLGNSFLGPYAGGIPLPFALLGPGSRYLYPGNITSGTVDISDIYINNYTPRSNGGILAYESVLAIEGNR